MIDPYIKLAKQTIKEYITKGVIIEPPKNLPKEMFTRKAGVFVSLHKKEELRGCIGTFLLTKENTAQEIISNAISSATRDPRFAPIRPDELKDLEISVDILSEPEKIDSMEQLDPKKYGVIVKTIDGRSGLLLPNIEGINHPHEQVAIACAKAGILPHEKIQLYRFTVERHK